MATKNPIPSPVPANPRRNMPPRPPPQILPSSACALSPSFSLAPSRSLLGATIAASSSSSSTEELPCFTLLNWWPLKVEGDERKLAVSGFTEREQSFTSCPIAKRHCATTLQTEDGIVVYLRGSLKISRMRENGFSIQLCEEFLLGFPHWWQSWSSRIVSRPSSSNTNDAQAAQFYLERFQIGKVLDSVGSSFIEGLLNNSKKSPRDAADAVSKCSELPDGTPRFEEYTCRGDISAQEKPAALKDSTKGSAAVCREVGNGGLDMAVGSTSQGTCHVDTDCNASLASTGKCNIDENYKEEGNQNGIMRPRAREQEAARHLIEPDFICNRCPDHIPNELEDGSTNAGSSVKVDSTSQKGYCVGIGCIASFSPTEKCTRDEIYKEAGSQNDIMHPDAREHEAFENIPPLMASLTKQGCRNGTPNIAINQKPSGLEEERNFAHQVLRGPTRLPMTRTPISYRHESPITRGRVKSLSISTPESLKLKRTRSGRMVVPTLDPGSQSIVYDMEGSIMGVAITHLKGSKPRTPASARSKRAR